MKRVEVRNAEEWDGALLALPNPHVLQSWAWGELKARYGWRATRLLFAEEGKTVAAASVLERRLGRLPVSVQYVPKGPALDWDDGEVRSQVLGELEALARRRRALFLKVDPDVYYPEEAPAFARRPACAPALVEALSGRGWHFSAEQVQFRNTVLLDLGQSDDTLLAAMKEKSRYNVRLARRRGVTVRAGSRDDLGLFHELYAETAGRDRFLIRPPDYYADSWGSFLDRGMARLLLAEVEGEAVAGMILFVFGPTAWYMYGASSDRHREDMPNHLLQWEACRAAREAGCRLYDLWGAPDTLAETDPMWGVYRFKLGLGGKLARGLGAWDFPNRALGYWLYTEAMPRILRRMRKRGGHEGA